MQNKQGSEEDKEILQKGHLGETEKDISRKVLQVSPRLLYSSHVRSLQPTL